MGIGIDLELYVRRGVEFRSFLFVESAAAATQSAQPAPAPAPAAPQTKSNVDINAMGTYEGQAIIDVDPDLLDDKPWRRPGADLSDYFNYGFNEETWKLYCQKQKNMLAQIQKKVSD